MSTLTSCSLSFIKSGRSCSVDRRGTLCVCVCRRSRRKREKGSSYNDTLCTLCFLALAQLLFSLSLSLSSVSFSSHCLLSSFPLLLLLVFFSDPFLYFRLLSLSSPTLLFFIFLPSFMSKTRSRKVMVKLTACLTRSVKMRDTWCVCVRKCVEKTEDLVPKNSTWSIALHPSVPAWLSCVTLWGICETPALLTQRKPECLTLTWWRADYSYCSSHMAQANAPHC